MDINKPKYGTSSYRVACAVIFVSFSIIYLFHYQTNVLAAAQHIASGGKTHYDPVIGPLLIIVATGLLQRGVRALSGLRGIFHALTYFPSFLIITIITDLPSKADREINFGAWIWTLPLLLLIWAAAVYLAKQYQSIETDTRGGGLLSQETGINMTMMLAMMVMTCLIGNHNREFHRCMETEFLISEKEYDRAIRAVEEYNSDTQNLTILRAYALAKKHKIGDEMFKFPIRTNSIIPSSKGFYAVIIPMDNIIGEYKRNIDWQLTEMLVKKNIGEFYDNLAFFYGLDNNAVAPDSTKQKSAKPVTVKKQNEYQDSLTRIKWMALPLHYKEALVLYNDKVRKIRQDFLDPQLLNSYNQFLRADNETKLKRFKGTFWVYFYFKNE